VSRKAPADLSGSYVMWYGLLPFEYTAEDMTTVIDRNKMKLGAAELL